MTRTETPADGPGTQAPDFKLPGVDEKIWPRGHKSGQAGQAGQGDRPEWHLLKRKLF